MNVPRRAYGWVFESLLFKGWERYVKHRAIPGYLDALERSQWLEEEEIAALQLASLRALLTHAKSHVPYYRELFGRLGFDARDLGRREDLAELPVLTKEIIRERYADLVDPALAAGNTRKGTSGSTGTPLLFEHSRDSYAWRQATRIRSYQWAGFRLGMPTLHYWGQTAPPRGLLGVKVRLDRAMKRDTFVDSMRSDEVSMLRAVEVLRRVRPACLVVYTQSCALWARFILDRGLRDWPDIPVVCGAEAVLPQDREVLSRAFGPGVFETYGSREVMLMSAECEAHDGMHLAEENVLLEITHAGRPVAAGESGDVVVTDLHNYGFPFIRYVNGDLATLHTGRACACGRGLRRLRSVEGRRADTLVDRDGKPIPGLLFHVLFGDTCREVASQFQVVQKKDRSVTLKMVRGPGWSDESLRTIEARVGGYLRGLPMKVEECRQIPAAANGKRRTIVVET